MSISSSSTFSGSRNEGMLLRMSPPARASFSNIDDLVAERHEIVGHRERRRARRRCTRPSCRSSVAGALGRRSVMSSFRSAATRLRRQMATGFSSRRVRRHAGSHGLSQVLPRMPGKTFDSPIDHVRVRVAALGDEPDVLGNVGVRGAGPLAIDDFVEVTWIRRVGRLQRFESPHPGFGLWIGVLSRRFGTANDRVPGPPRTANDLARQRQGGWRAGFDGARTAGSLHGGAGSAVHGTR